jgi:AraC family transcriptional regulator
MKAGSIELASERVGHLVRRAMTFLESDREAAWQCLNEVAALLGPRAQDSDTNSTLAIEPSSPGGLAAWQAKRTLAYIEENLGSKLVVTDLSCLVSLSNSHFSRAFKRSLGLPPMAYVRSRRVERAKVMMNSTREQLTEIALACGFADQSHLSRSFRRLVGVSPGIWRRSKAEWVGLASYGEVAARASGRIVLRPQD